MIVVSQSTLTWASLGAIIYEVVTGQRCEFDLFQGNYDDGNLANPTFSSQHQKPVAWNSHRTMLDKKISERISYRRPWIPLIQRGNDFQARSIFTGIPRR
jgi:hypothetical protein